MLLYERRCCQPRIQFLGDEPDLLCVHTVESVVAHPVNIIRTPQRIESGLAFGASGSSARQLKKRASRFLIFIVSWIRGQLEFRKWVSSCYWQLRRNGEGEKASASRIVLLRSSGASWCSTPNGQIRPGVSGRSVSGLRCVFKGQSVSVLVQVTSS